MRQDVPVESGQDFFFEAGGAGGEEYLFPFEKCLIGSVDLTFQVHVTTYISVPLSHPLKSERVLSRENRVALCKQQAFPNSISCSSKSTYFLPHWSVLLWEDKATANAVCVSE